MGCPPSCLPSGYHFRETGKATWWESPRSPAATAVNLPVLWISPPPARQNPSAVIISSRFSGLRNHLFHLSWLFTWAFQDARASHHKRKKKKQTHKLPYPSSPSSSSYGPISHPLRWANFCKKLLYSVHPSLVLFLSPLQSAFQCHLCRETKTTSQTVPGLLLLRLSAAFKFEAAAHIPL